MGLHSETRPLLRSMAWLNAIPGTRLRLSHTDSRPAQGAEATPKDMVGVPLTAASRFVTIAAPAYLARRSRPKTPGDLQGHDGIRLRLASGRLFDWTFAKDGEVQKMSPPEPITLSEVTLQVEAAANGLGIAYVWEDAARWWIDRGSVEVILDDWSFPASPLLLYYPRGRPPIPALRALIQVVRAEPMSVTLTCLRYVSWRCLRTLCPTVVGEMRRRIAP